MSGIDFGGYTLYPIQTGHFRLDGGAMFGVVPKTLWSKKIEADSDNRIQMCSRSLLIQSKASDRLYLIDTGVGTKFNEKFQRIYGIDFSRGSLESEINAAGFDLGQITDVIFTHLHFDHCGGASRWNADKSTSELIFPNANLWVTKSHWNTAIHPNQREAASFLRENLDPIARHPRLIFTEGAHVFEDDFYTMIVNGHTTGQQLPVLEDGDRKLVFAADLIPTHAHAPIPWVMGYDMFPLTTMEERMKLLPEAVMEGWYFFLEHDATHEVMQLENDGNNFRMKRSLALSDL